MQATLEARYRASIRDGSDCQLIRGEGRPDCGHPQKVTTSWKNLISDRWWNQDFLKQFLHEIQPVDPGQMDDWPGV